MIVCSPSTVLAAPLLLSHGAVSSTRPNALTMLTGVHLTFLQDQAARDARQAEEAKRVDDPSAKLLIPIFKILPPRARSVSFSLGVNAHLVCQLLELQVLFLAGTSMQALRMHPSVVVHLLSAGYKDCLESNLQWRMLQRIQSRGQCLPGRRLQHLLAATS